MTFTFPCVDNTGSAPRGASHAPLCISLHLSKGDKEKSPGRTLSPKREDISAADAPRILIVEDTLLVAWHLESLLRELNFEVCGLAANGEDAIEQATESAPNVLLMDVNLGKGIDGIEAARRIRQSRNSAVIFITAYSDAANLERIERAFPGAPILTKPVTPEHLRAAIITVRKVGLTN
jgi:CheY-like chemotaxis protein